MKKAGRRMLAWILAVFADGAGIAGGGTGRRGPRHRRGYEAEPGVEKNWRRARLVARW